MSEKDCGEFTYEEYEVAIETKVPVYVFFTDTECNCEVSKFKNSLDEGAISYDINTNKINYYVAKIIDKSIPDNIPTELKENGIYINGNCVEYE